MKTKPIFTVSCLVLALGGCPGGAKLEKVAAIQDAGVTTWTAESDGGIGRLELYVAETGDPGSTCGATGRYPDDCGFWSERHDAFVRVGQSTAYGGDRFALTLTRVDNFADQVDNVSTLFDLGNAQLTPHLTVAVKMFDADGTFVDCAVYGHQPSYFQPLCVDVRAGTPW